MSEGDDGQGGSRQTEEPMQQDASQAGGEDDRASTRGVSSQDFNIFSDLENNADTLETNEPADEGISTLEPPSAFMEMKRNLPESSSPGNSRNNEQKILMESPRRRRIEGSARVPFLSWKRCPKKSGKYITETMKVGRDVDWTEWRSWKKSGQ